MTDKELIKLVHQQVEVMQQALEALENGIDGQTSIEMDNAVIALREALAKQPTLRPCRSPYCECSVGKCSHLGCYDARAEPWPPAQQEPCCGKYADCQKACTPRGRWLAQQEPVAWIWKYANGEEEVVFVSPRHIDATHVDAPSTITPLYKSLPAQRTWVGLTDEEWSEVYNRKEWDTECSWEYERAIEAKLKAKNSL